MFLGEERVAAVRTMIFADSEADEQAAYDTLLPLQRDDFVGIFQAMDNKPVTVRLLDPPLHGSCPTRSSWPWPSPWPRSGARRRSRSAR